ncbi:hypothetical protein CLN94_12975 [Pseudothioclava arenosa]|uniref:Uncharacterized protein n=1 Tax=Pseudothioclava arenosa TaxID=1795308 RepID=A0A2A4CMW1_9RHOB|nr:hypothetical protein CLN94_12975 [Pseudothioclava arenosa]
MIGQFKPAGSGKFIPDHGGANDVEVLFVIELAIQLKRQSNSAFCGDHLCQKLWGGARFCADITINVLKNRT